MSMTLEEAILHAEEAASDYEGMIEDYWLDSEKLAKCANEQRQLANWLKELAERRELPEIVRCGECELKIECCRNIRSGGRKNDDFCSCGRRAERRTDGSD